jgi:uncharacterized protein
MMRHFSSVERNVELDECPSCGAIWLDPGELGGIRQEFDTDEERRQAADAYFTEVFSDDLAAENAKSDAELAKARKFAHAFRFICPSYYIPGEQAWGAY